MKPLQLEEDAPWRQRFRAPWIANTQLARQNPAQGLLMSNESGLFQIYRWDPQTNKYEQLTHRPDGVLNHAFSPDGRYVYYLHDEKGNELGHFVRIPYEGGEEVDITPDLPAYSPAGFTFSRSGNAIGLTVGTQDGFRLYIIPQDEQGNLGQRREIFHSLPLIFGPVLSYDGRIAVVMSTEKTGKPEFALLAFDTETGEKIGELWDGAGNSIGAIMFAPVPGDNRLLATTNRSGYERLLLWDPRTGERVDLDFPDMEGAFSAFDWSRDGRRILVRTFNQAVQQFYTYDVESGRLNRLNHPSGTITGPYFTPSGEIYVHLQDATHRSRLVALDGETGEQLRVVLEAAQVPPDRPWRSVHFPSSDGQMVQAWLATPEGEGPFPTIVDMIGGPGSVQVEAFSPQSQAWLDHGFAWLSVNYRGCTTFGREFETQIYGNPGHWEVEDITTARDWLVEQGIADPERMLVTGWSYGGYLTLMNLSKRPELWAGGMAGIAIADWTIQYEDSAEMLRGFQRAILGGTPEENPEQYAISSPITYAEQVRAPVLIIQGRNDTRTPARPIEVYEQKMHELGKDITVHWYDTGHGGGFADSGLAERHQEIMLRFAYRVLG